MGVFISILIDLILDHIIAKAEQTIREKQIK
jgi:hypothetical protein